MSSALSRWQALLQLDPPDGSDSVGSEFWADAMAEIRQLITEIPERPGRLLGRDLCACADGVGEQLQAGHLFEAEWSAAATRRALGGAVSGTVAGRYRSALRQLQRCLQDWWEEQGSLSLVTAMGRIPTKLETLPGQAVPAALMGLPIKERRELRSLLLPRITRWLHRTYERQAELQRLLRRVREARADEVMARRKLGLPEEGALTLDQVEGALAAVAAGEPGAHPARRRRWHEAAENLRLLVRLDSRETDP